MEGDRRCHLLEPDPATETTTTRGLHVPGNPIRHEVWATRYDRGGRETLTAETETGDWTSRFRCRVYDAIKGATNAWGFEDEAGVTWRIENITLEQVPTGPAWWNILCLRLT